MFGSLVKGHHVFDSVYISLGEYMQGKKIVLLIKKYF